MKAHRLGPRGTCTWTTLSDEAAKPEQCRESQTCRRSVCRGLWS